MNKQPTSNRNDRDGKILSILILLVCFLIIAAALYQVAVYKSR